MQGSRQINRSIVSCGGSETTTNCLGPPAGGPLGSKYRFTGINFGVDVKFDL